MNILCCSKSLAYKCSNVPKVQKRFFWMIKWKSFKRWQDLAAQNKEYREDVARTKNFFPLNDGMYIPPEKAQDIQPRKASADMTRKDQHAMSLEFSTNRMQLRYLDWSFDNIRQCKEYEYFQFLQYDQRFLPERLLFLGPDLAAAHFIAHRRGAVKFVGDDTWYKRNVKGAYNFPLPGRKVPGLFLEAIDASDTELMFEGFDNLYDLESLRMLSVARVERADDWVLSRIGGMFSESLEFLDISGCKRISAKGLLGLRNCKKLKYLRVEGLDKVQDIAKSALLLEESIPNLTVVGLDYEAALDKLEGEKKLLENDRLIIDAKGNAFVEDDNGRLFYVNGKVNERPAVCDDDKPIMTSTIRREIPAMSDATFEELDQLSNGKLRHLLVGSPSGPMAYEWNEPVETILSFEKKWKQWEGIPLDPKMLPKDKRMPRLEQANTENLSVEQENRKIESNV